MDKVTQKRRWKRSNAYWKVEKKEPTDKRWLLSQKIKDIYIVDQKHFSGK